MVEATNQGLDWGDEIPPASEDNYRILDAGVYPFFVEKFDRKYFSGSEKLSACNEADLTLRVRADDGEIVFVKTRLMLHDRWKWKLSQFFTSIGLQKPGESLKMDWSKVPGAIGKAYVEPNTFTSRSGKTITKNDVTKFVGDGDLSDISDAVAEFEELTDNSDELPF